MFLNFYSVTKLSISIPGSHLIQKLTCPVIILMFKNNGYRFRGRTSETLVMSTQFEYSM
ncbi:hypothetical protein C7972_10392 [Arenibacter sp. ARW7G5Y1]|nr:hypothetical protein C7972_10392 [Arenibacter sp. ARW7G5Y1]